MLVEEPISTLYLQGEGYRGPLPCWEHGGYPFRHVTQGLLQASATVLNGRLLTKTQPGKKAQVAQPGAWPVPCSSQER